MDAIWVELFRLALPIALKWFMAWAKEVLEGGEESSVATVIPLINPLRKLEPLISGVAGMTAKELADIIDSADYQVVAKAYNATHTIRVPV